ncbi:TetR/AcrR family transcriptional regulator [Thalassotalea fonticola]|uniref:TetR/AcrR family transcriptional regulator n=1 Tax=Thalassotalea fonticola TaxID=3065649 RepID=A0ABZ0GQZ3_9GAMM|nr:TetR/AcrR family transcriptional regulator [Colwelliaceae bacterium S1-1]
MAESTITPQSILNKALALAQKSSWESFSLLTLADSLNCDLSIIRSHFRSKDDMAEALFDQADAAMLHFATQQTNDKLTSDERLINCIMAWLNFLSPYKSLVKEILAYKFELGHLHLQAHGITRVSRTVQWFLHAAKRDYSGLKRVGDELSVTSAYLLSLGFYFVDKSEQHNKTRAFLQRMLNRNRQVYHLLKAISRPVRQHK